MERTHARRPGRTGLLVMMAVAVSFGGCLDEDQYGDPVATDAVRIPGEWVFEPKAIKVPANTTVTWINEGGQAHTVTFERIDIDKTIAPDETFRHTFGEPGTYDYVCRFHPPDMVGRVLVTPADAAANGADTDG